MRCARCSAVLESGQDICSRCGAGNDAVPGAVPLVIGTQGVPVESLSPSAQGPLVAPEPYVTPPSVRTRKVRGYRVVQPVPARPVKRRRWVRYVLAFVALAAVVGAGIFAGQALARLGQPVTPGVQTALRGTATPLPACPLAASLQSTELTHIQFARGVRDAARGDLRPVQPTNDFLAGEMVHLTFQIATQQAGTASVRFCLDGRMTSAALSVPERSSGRYGQFSMSTTVRDRGIGTAVVMWNGKIVAVTQFRVTF